MNKNHYTVISQTNPQVSGRDRGLPKKGLVVSGGVDRTPILCPPEDPGSLPLNVSDGGELRGPTSPPYIPFPLSESEI